MTDAYNRSHAEIAEDLVMEQIAWMSDCSSKMEEAVLDHLTQIHKFRDAQFCDRMCRRLDCELTWEQHYLIEAMQTW